MDLKLTGIIKIIDNIIIEVNSFIEDAPVGVNEEEIKNIELLTNFSNALLPSIKKELLDNQEILSEVIMSSIIFDSFNSLEGKITSIILSGDKNYVKLRKLVSQSYNVYNIRRDFRIFRALTSNYNKKIDNLENKLLSDNEKKFENEVVLIKDQYEKSLIDSKKKYEFELKELRLKLKTITENNDTTLKNLFDFYEDQLKAVKNSEYEDKRSKDKIFSDFIEKSREEKDFVIDETLKEKEKIISEIKVEKDGMVQSFEEYFHKIQTDWKRIQQIKTENVYLNAYHKNTARSKNSENKFIAVTALSLFLSVLTIIAFIFKAIDFSQFISIKIMIVVFFGILIAYYLRISTHYRRLADQAEQTHLELLAFPQYAAELGEEKSREIKEQLALKYFGKEIDASGYQKISDIAQEQLKTSSELVKAAASLSVASTKTSGGAQNNENNEAQNTSSPSGKK